MRELLQYASRFRRLYQKEFRPQGEATGLSQLEMDIVLFLRNNPEQNTARDIVALRGFAKSNVSTAVEALEHGGWLEVLPDPESRRVKRLVLRKEHCREIEDLAACQERCFSAALADFTPEDLTVLRKLMSRMDANVQRALAQ